MAYVFGSPSEKKCQSSLIFYCKIPILCQSSAISAKILLVMFDRTVEFRELCIQIVSVLRLIIQHTSVFTASLISECEASGAQAIHSTTCSCSRNSALHSLVAVTQTLTVCNKEKNPRN